MKQVIVYPKADSPTTLEKFVKNADDLKKLKYLFPDMSKASLEPYLKHREEMGELGVVASTLGISGLHDWCKYIEGSLEAATYMYYDYPDEMEDLREHIHQHYITKAKRFLEAEPDFLFIAASGLITLQSPSIFRHLSLPSIKEIAEIAKKAGIPSHMHTCGKARELVEVCTDG